VLRIHEGNKEGAAGTQIKLHGEELRNLCPLPDEKRKMIQGEVNLRRKGASG
jgi:hypothetical protein